VLQDNSLINSDKEMMPMPYISHEYQFLFYSAPATGSTAVIDAFQKREIGEYYPLNNIIENDKRVVPRKHATPQQMEEYDLLSDEIQEYFHFVGVRNPFSFHVAKYLRNKTRRMNNLKNPKSWINKLPDKERERYAYRIRKSAKQSFSQYLVTEFKKLSEPKAVQQHFHKGINRFIHQENMNEDLQQVCEILGIEPVVSTEKVNVTNAMKSGETYHDYYDEEAIDLVNKWNAPSFELFPEYSFEGFNSDKVVI